MCARTVPCPPELTALLHEYIEQFGAAPDGRLFVGERNDRELPKLTIVRAWQQARRRVFTEEVAASQLARTPYDLRHAAVSTWRSGRTTRSVKFHATRDVLRCGPGRRSLHFARNSTALACPDRCTRCCTQGQRYSRVITGRSPSSGSRAIRGLRLPICGNSA